MWSYIRKKIYLRQSSLLQSGSGYGIGPLPLLNHPGKIPSIWYKGTLKVPAILLRANGNNVSATSYHVSTSSTFTSPNFKLRNCF